MQSAGSCSIFGAVFILKACSIDLRHLQRLPQREQARGQRLGKTIGKGCGQGRRSSLKEHHTARVSRGDQGARQYMVADVSKVAGTTFVVQ
jgi:hypothetical protein